MSTYGVDLSTWCFIMSKVYVIMLKIGSSCLRVTCLDYMLCQTHVSFCPHNVACLNFWEQHHTVEQDNIFILSTYGVDLSTRCFIMSKVYVIMLKIGSSCLRVTYLDYMLCQTHVSFCPHNVACLNFWEQHHTFEQDNIFIYQDNTAF